MPVCIAGMHRSGTSMVTKLLRECGLYLGDERDLILPASYNSDGFWEHSAFIRINEAILQELKGSWDSPPPISHEDLQKPALLAMQSETDELCQQFADREPWGWKDPRNSITLPFWRGLYPRLKVVICVRNPLEVVLSLRRRGYKSATRAMELWESYSLRALEAVPPQHRILTHYDAYFARPIVELQRVVRFLGIRVTDDAIRACAGPIRSQRHSWLQAKHLQDVGVPRKDQELYYKMCAEAGWEELRADLRTTLPVHDSLTGTSALEQTANGNEQTPANGEQEGRLPLEAELLRRDLEVESSRVQLESVMTQLEERSAWAKRSAEIVAQRDQTIQNLRAQLQDRESTMREALSKQTQQLDTLTSLVEILVEGTSGELQKKAEDLRNRQAYKQLVPRLQKHVCTTIPLGSTFLVVSKGDDQLVQVDGSSGWHFPQDEKGVYAGFHPASSAAAIAHLEALRARGADYLVLPKTAFWWLDHYAAFRAHLDRTYRLIHRSDDTCLIFALRESSPWRAVGELIADFKTRHRRCPAILNWESGLDLAKTFPECAVFAPMDPGNDSLPYLEESIDMVAVRTGAPDRLGESRRVASAAVLIVAADGSGKGDLELIIERRRNAAADAEPVLADRGRPGVLGGNGCS